MIRSLREERGAEKMSLNNASHRRADLAQTPRPFSAPLIPDSVPSSSTSANKTLTQALQHRDKLLTYQRQNAQRTHIVDEAADFETPAAGQSMWSSPEQRAAQLKRQQKVLREQEWNARPEYEKRRVVLSVDLVGKKVVRRMGEVEMPRDPNDEDVSSEVDKQRGESGSRAFSNNPLLGDLIRPVWKGRDNTNVEHGNGEDKENEPRRSAWRRVQDDEDDNEAWILNGGVYGGRETERELGGEERPCG